MFPLDPRTVQRLAEVIVDMEGPYERKGWELERLLRHAGWQDVAPYDGSPRIQWLVEQMVDRGSDQAATERLLCRVCDAVEYDDGIASAEVFRQSINDKLHPEQLVITFVGGRPVLGELDSTGSNPVFSEPPEFEQRLRTLVRERSTAEALVRRAAETRIAEQGGAHTLAIIGIGSVVEGLLLAFLLENDSQLKQKGFVDKQGRSVRPERAGMELLIDTAHRSGWIQLDAKNFMHTVRDFRNFVHPRKVWDEQPEFDEDSIRLCWAPVHALLNDLEQRIAETSAVAT
ncbi:hypothetical protein [Actinophytocola glycyrrhizae]|uniref:DUF4145 domain-containing protein n=1 Tax=Actinophytocola glycyrrhizae TaxID=2044873 RepID=A0ABV9S4K9_9PSEU